MSTEKVGFRDEVFMEVVERECEEEEKENDEIKNKKQSREDR